MVRFIHKGSVVLTLALLGLGVSACSKTPAETAPDTTVVSGSESPAPSESGDCELRSPPTTPEECTCAGGVIHGDIGDGKVACAPDETELGRIQQGIEGAVCCRPAAQTL